MQFEHGCNVLEKVALAAAGDTLYRTRSVVLSELHQGLDLDGDGEMDVSHELNSSDWEHHRTVWLQSGVLDSTNFRLDKVGDGEAIFEYLSLGLCYDQDR